ncbi:hypothetical protein OC25_01685 [Pedobacter kyungheensis]|uniref:Uncharacterized protein n=1 Tax=Pedobacter kyungheensis TaxID=1069985 RepID=A0A0C1FUA6_9SPHI|nr:hypothetical protein [Pedobacter kyungheensis]KIA96492.1 hypothetical protein OC25_01685 [Pedobacter kyungheensis]
MKTLICLLFGLVLANTAYSQKKNIDYQYFREGKTYYAFSLFSDAVKAPGNLMLDFTTKAKFSKIEKISLKAGGVEVKLKFGVRTDLIQSDNPEQKAYPVIFNASDIIAKNLSCDGQITFKLDNGETYTLPFNACLIK